jgi:enoyl-CoA hydratase
MMTLSPTERMIARKDGAIGWMIFNNPARRNAVSLDMWEAMPVILEEFEKDPAIRVIVLTGAGDRAFVAGADIRSMAEYTADEGREFGELGHAATRAIELASQPVIAAVNGFALGGGCELALACDIRIASTTAVFAQPEVSLGIPPGWGGSQRLPRVVGPGMAAELIFTGRRVDAVEALRIGLINSVYEPDRLMSAANALADAIAANSPVNVRAAKRLIAMTRGADQDGLDAEASAFADAFTIPDRREGMHAFLERRKPVFNDGEKA